MFRIIFTIVLFSIALKLNGQATENFRYADSLTYSLYIEKSWNKLISAGNNAIKNGHDYYYLRMRIAIAYYEKHNYVKSAEHFRIALELNTNDQIALEYLFYSYYLSGHSYQAQSLMPLFYPQNRDRIVNESKLRKNIITFESFFSDSGTDDIISDPDAYFSDREAGSQIVTKYFINNSVSASHIIGNHVSYYHAFTNLLKENHLHYFDGSISADLLSQRVIQNQYYASLNFFTSTGWIISPSFHFITAGYPLISISTSGMNSSAKTYNVRSNGYFAGTAISKNTGFIVIGAEAGYSHINFLSQVHGTASFMVYPSGNSDIYIGAKVSAGMEIESSLSDLKIVSGFTGGFSIARKVWMELSGLMGEMNNYVSDNGLYIYNSPDILHSRFSGRIIIPVQKDGITIFAGGGISTYSSELIPEDGQISFSTNKLSYNSNNFTGGISWKF